jgi:hypothetical protein
MTVELKLDGYETVSDCWTAVRQMTSANRRRPSDKSDGYGLRRRIDETSGFDP